jgi:GGDEF domain-containing protein
MVFKFGDIHLNITPSIGIINYLGDGKTAYLLIKHADQAMYKIK